MGRNMTQAPAPNSGSMFSREFWLLLSSSVLFMMSFSFPLFEFAEYLGQMPGGTEYVGFIIGLFTVSAGISRFWSGRLADRIGRKPIMLFGTLVVAVCGGLYLFTTTIWTFLALRFIHGMSTGWRPTAATAMLSDIVPPKRIGEAMGYLGMAGAAGTAIGPLLGSIVKEHFSFDAMFVCASIMGVIALIMTAILKETLPNPERFKVSSLGFKKGEKVLDRVALPAFMTTLFETFSFGAVITLAPLLVDHLGFVYKGSFNPTFIATSFVVRFIAGKASDRWGRIKPMMLGMGFTIAAMVTLSMAETRGIAICGGILYGFGIGLNRPTVFAWATDLARPGHIALSMATLLLALEIGIGSGAFLTGWLFEEADAAATISMGFQISAVTAVLGLVYLIWYQRKTKLQS